VATAGRLRRRLLNCAAFGLGGRGVVRARVRSTQLSSVPGLTGNVHG